MADDEHNPWAGRAVRFAFGAAFGVIVGLAGRAYAGDGRAWAWMAGAVVVCGVLAAALKDEFWKNLGWWPW